MGMLNYETLLSSYNDKLTLMQWLKKVEAALKNASATSFVLNKKGNATISFSLTFEDETSLESGDIVLQQGESVESAYIQNGHLHLVLTNGDDLDAGDLLDGNPLTIPAANVDFIGNVLIEGALSVDGPAVIDGTAKLNTISSDGTNITALKPVIEDMAGYTFTPSTPIANLNLTLIYAGAVKNGNKLTFVISGTIEKTGAVSGNQILGTFKVPASIHSKLFPIRIGLYDYLDVKKMFVANEGWAGKEMYAVIQKLSSNNVQFSLNSFTDLSVNVQYYFRIEETFLLSENLAA